MAAADQLFEQIFNEHLNNLHTFMPCKIITYYPDELKADLQPIFKRIKGGQKQDYPMINKAPVSRTVVIYPERKGNCTGCCGCTVVIPEHHEKLEPDEIVLVCFAERALDQVGLRRHDLTDAVVIGRL